jgi:protease-4
MNKLVLWGIIVLAGVGCGCSGPTIKLFRDHTDPFQESVLEGTQKQKILVISLEGMISDKSRRKFLGSRPSKVLEVVSQLRRAEKDDNIGAIILKVDSFGGTATASDILYNEISRLKQRRNIKVVAALMDVAASGGYYVSLPADWIIAHPTTVTGSVGVLFVRPDMVGLMEKLGVGVKVNKSGKNKDMGAFYRKPTDKETEVFQNVVDKLADRFFSLVKQHRNLSVKTLESMKTARVYLADEAFELGLIDQIGYLSDAVEKARNLAGLPDDCKVIVYRRTEFAEDNIYNSTTMAGPGDGPELIGAALKESFQWLTPGFYYIWQP